MGPIISMINPMQPQTVGVNTGEREMKLLRQAKIYDDPKIGHVPSITGHGIDTTGYGE